jgi:sec-independent protein translocase protein TatA
MDASLTIIPAFNPMGGGMHWIIILVVVVLLFGKRLPEILRGLGGSVREFKKGLDHDEAPPAAPPTADKIPEQSGQHK